jgi:hypothetical protein
MLTKEEYIAQLKRNITFYIGTNAADNFDAISAGGPEDIWFHADDASSCHVIAVMPEDIDRKEKLWIIKCGARLVKQHTKKFVSMKNLPVICTEIQNIEMTDTAGKVIVDPAKIKTIVVK